MEEAPRARVVDALIKVRAQLACFEGAPGVGPRQELGGGAARTVDPHQAVPVAGDTDAEDIGLAFAASLQCAVDTLGDERDEFPGIRGDLTGLRRANLVRHIGEGRGPYPPVDVVDDGADGGGPDIEGQDARLREGLRHRSILADP
jgi:hypothetical protein